MKDNSIHSAFSLLSERNGSTAAEWILTRPSLDIIFDSVIRLINPARSPSDNESIRVTREPVIEVRLNSWNVEVIDMSILLLRPVLSCPFRVSWMLFLLIILLCSGSLSMDRVPVPTATVIDDGTGQPIEGAVAIAVWRKHSIWERAIWEGGTLVVRKIEEAVSDRDGNIFIDGFWGWYMSPDRYPHITIYKPGYICWDQKDIFPEGRRTDFDQDHRIARMVKWQEGLSYDQHEGFIYSCTYGNYNDAPKHLFHQATDYEIPFRRAEIYKRDEKWRNEREEERKWFLELQKKRRDAQ